MSIFTNNLIVSPLPDGCNWVLRSEYCYDVGEEGSDDRVIVPIGFVTDFASVPRFLWNIAPKTGKYTGAAVIHDYLYWEGKRSRKECDDIFLEAMTVLGVEKWKRDLMYFALRGFGWIFYNSGQKEKDANLFVKPLDDIMEIPEMDLDDFLY